MPAEKRENRIRSVSDLVKAYEAHYSINHRPQSILFSGGRLTHVKRLPGPALLPDLTQDAIRGYIKTRLNAGAGGRTINMEVGELSRAIGQRWSVIWPEVRKLEERKDVCRAKTSSGTGRQIPMNSDLFAVLSVHAAWFTKRFGQAQPEHYLFPFGKPTPSDPTRPITNVSGAWAALRTKAGIFSVGCTISGTRWNGTRISAWRRSGRRWKRWRSPRSRTRTNQRRSPQRRRIQMGSPQNPHTGHLGHDSAVCK
jgi:hypothetical protein